ncbi:hypothetical protein PISL3812_08478 [Talaromyces islandicus]|uniref:DUF2415 domain-containing protein n=1 Tax=Talaromyces islandicus TaxID=28573 RepID=A0A0U1M8Z2_TALIS|nr:hypothetical protein PISL3812_08478 [Talaromyces islandicus]
MTLDYTLPCLSTDALLLPSKRRFFPFKVPNLSVNPSPPTQAKRQKTNPFRCTSSHRQLRHYISTADPDRIYLVVHKVVHSIHIKSQKWDTIERVPFEPKCLAAAYGWIVVGGSDNGECAFIKLPGRHAPHTPRAETRAEELDVDTALPIDLDFGSRTPPAAPHGEPSQSGVEGDQNDIPEIFTKTLSGSIVNSVTIHRLPGDNERFAHEDIVVFSNNDKTVRLFSLTRTKLLQTINHPTCMNYSVISPDSRILAAVGDENFAYFYRIVRDSATVDYGEHGQRVSGWSCKFICRIELPLSTTMRASDDGSCFTIAFSPASHLCAIGSQAGLISVFDVESILENKEDSQCRLQVFRSSRPDSDAGAVRSMAFSPDPWDLLVWVEDMGKFGIADVRSGFLRRQVVDLDKDDPEVEKIRTTFRSPFISRSAGDRLDDRADEDAGGVQRAMLDFLGGTSSTTPDPSSSERVSSLRESIQGLTDRERRIIEFLNTARWSSRQEGDEGERPPRTPSNLRHSANASSLGGADVADPSPRTTSPFRSTDTALHELFREHYLGRVGSTERNFGQRRRGSIVVSQPGSGSDSNMENNEDGNSTADVQVLLRWTTSPVEVQPFESSSRPDENNSAESGFRPIELETTSTGDRQSSQRSRSIPRRSSRPGAGTDSRYDTQRTTTAEMRASVTAERLRRQRLAANETRSPRWFRDFLNNDAPERHLAYMPHDQEPGGTAGVGWGADARSLYIGTVDGIFEFQINVQDRKSFPAFSFR